MRRLRSSGCGRLGVRAALPVVLVLGVGIGLGGPAVAAPPTVAINWQGGVGVAGGGFDRATYQGTVGESVIITNDANSPLTVTFTNQSDKATTPTSVVVAPKGAMTGNPRTAPAVAGTFLVHGADGMPHLNGTVDARLQVNPAPATTPAPTQPAPAGSPAPASGAAGNPAPPASGAAGSPAPPASGAGGRHPAGSHPAAGGSHPAGAAIPNRIPAAQVPPGGVAAMAPGAPFVFNPALPSGAPTDIGGAPPSIAAAPGRTPELPTAASTPLPPTQLGSSTLSQSTGLPGMSVPNRALGLPAAIAGIAVVALGFALARVLLPHPAAPGASRAPGAPGLPVAARHGSPARHRRQRRLGLSRLGQGRLALGRLGPKRRGPDRRPTLPVEVRRG